MSRLSCRKSENTVMISESVLAPRFLSDCMPLVCRDLLLCSFQSFSPEYQQSVARLWGWPRVLRASCAVSLEAVWFDFLIKHNFFPKKIKNCTRNSLHQSILHSSCGQSQGFSRCFRDPIRVPRIKKWVSRLRENYHRVPSIREIGPITGYLIFSLKRKTGQSPWIRRLIRVSFLFRLNLLAFSCSGTSHWTASSAAVRIKKKEITACTNTPRAARCSQRGESEKPGWLLCLFSFARFSRVDCFWRVHEMLVAFLPPKRVFTLYCWNKL